MKEGEDFIILEGLRSKHVKNSTKWVHIVRPTAVNNKFKIGSISEEKETLFIGDQHIKKGVDVTVAPDHAELSFRDGSFWLQEFGTMYGTYVAVKRMTALAGNHQKVVQVGRTALMF